MTTEHDATSVGASCYGVAGTQTIFSDGFESNNFTTGGWTNSGMTLTGTARTGTYAANDGGTAVRYIEKTVSTTGYTNPQLSLWFMSAGLDAGAEYLKIIVDSSDALHERQHQRRLQPADRLAAGGRLGDHPHRGQHRERERRVQHRRHPRDRHGRGGMPRHLRRGCDPQQLGVRCHHGRHAHVQGLPHEQRHAADDTHLRRRGPVTRMLTLPHTRCSSSPACTSCHSVSNDTRVIHAGLGDGCNVCHGGGGYTDIHSGQTAECASCHDGMATDEIPVDPNHYTGTETSHTATTQGSSTLGAWALSPTCSACHDMTLYSEHNAVTAAKTTVPANVCENCHLSTVLTSSPTVVASDWAARTGSSACIACHAVDTATNQHGQIALTGNHAVTDAAANCGSSGAGCHATANVAQVGTPSTTANIHTQCSSCHGTASRAHDALGTGALTGGCTSGAADCHNSASYSSTAQHATDTHTTLTGNEAIHQATNMATSLDTYTYNDNCSNCHSSYLGLAHKDTSTTANLDSGHSSSVTGWDASAQSSCRDCHNSPPRPATPPPAPSSRPTGPPTPAPTATPRSTASTPLALTRPRALAARCRPAATATPALRRSTSGRCTTR